jgi:dTDP-4-dehydrorhamnose reductase
MLNLFKNRESLNVIADQVGTPTWAYHLACFLWRLVESPETPPGVYHFTDAGVASWYDFAVAIEEESRKWRGKTVDIRPIRTDEYPTKAMRPSYSALEKRFPETLSGFTYVHWREALRRMLGRLLVE